MPGTWSRPARPGRSRWPAGSSTEPASPVPDAMVEIWQADRHGHFGPDAEPDWTGFGRALSSRRSFAFTTVKPGALPGPAIARETLLAIEAIHRLVERAMRLAQIFRHDIGI